MNNSFDSAYKSLISRNAAYKNEVVNNVLQQSGFTDGHIVDSIHDTPNHSAASVSASIPDEDDADENKTNYAAAWYGLYTDTPSTLVFKTDKQGPDSLYKFHMQGDGNSIRNKLNDYGIDQRLMIPSENGFHIIIHDLGKSKRNSVIKLLNDNKIDDASELSGSSQFLGHPEDKTKARAHYRSVIDAYEGRGQQ